MAMTHARAPQRKMSPAGLGPLTLPAQICQRYQEASGALLASKATQPRHSSAATASLAAPQEGMALVDPKGVPWYPLPAGFSAEIPQPSQTCGKSRRKPACGIFQHRDVAQVATESQVSPGHHGQTTARGGGGRRIVGASGGLPGPRNTSGANTFNTTKKSGREPHHPHHHHFRMKVQTHIASTHMSVAAYLSPQLHPLV